MAIAELVEPQKVMPLKQIKLAKLGVKALPDLFEASLDGSNKKLSERSAAAIVRLGLAAMPFLISKLKNEKEALNATNIAGEILEKNKVPLGITEQGAQLLKQLTENLRGDSSTQRGCAAVLLGKTKTEKAAQPLVSALLDKNRVVATAVETALLELREKAVAGLISGLLGTNEKLSLKAEDVLVKLGKPALRQLYDVAALNCQRTVNLADEVFIESTEVARIHHKVAFLEQGLEFETLENVLAALKTYKETKKDAEGIEDNLKKLLHVLARIDSKGEYCAQFVVDAIEQLIETNYNLHLDYMGATVKPEVYAANVASSIEYKKRIYVEMAVADGVLMLLGADALPTVQEAYYKMGFSGLAKTMIVIIIKLKEKAQSSESKEKEELGGFGGPKEESEE